MEGFSTPFTSPLSVHSHESRRAGQDLGRRARTIATQKDRHNVAVLLNPKLSLQNFPEYDWYFRLWDDNYVIVENVPAALEGPPRILRSQSYPMRSYPMLSYPILPCAAAVRSQHLRARADLSCNVRIVSAVLYCTAAGLNPAEPWLVGLSFGKFPAGGAGWLVRQDNPMIAT